MTGWLQCHTCPDEDGRRAPGEAMCVECKRKLAHHNVNMQHDLMALGAHPDACGVCRGTGYLADEQPLSHLPDAGGQSLGARECVRCAGTGRRVARL